MADRARDRDAEKCLSHGAPSNSGVSYQEEDGMGPRMARSDCPLCGSDILDATSRGGYARRSERLEKVLGPVPEGTEQYHSADQRHSLQAESHYIRYYEMF